MRFFLSVVFVTLGVAVLVGTWIMEHGWLRDVGLILGAVIAVGPTSYWFGRHIGRSKLKWEVFHVREEIRAIRSMVADIEDRPLVQRELEMTNGR